MTDDLVERLRERSRQYVDNEYNFDKRAADRIEKLEADLKLSRWAELFEIQSNRIEQLEAIMRKLVEPFKASKLLFGAQHLRSVRVGDQVVEELLAAMEGKDD